MWYVLIAIIVLAVVVGAVWMFLAYLLMPIVLLIITAGTLTGLAIGLCGAYRGLSGSEPAGVPEERPNPEYRRGRGAPYPKRDNAWPHYLTAQLVHDVRNTVFLPAALTMRVIQALVAPMENTRRTGGGLWAWGPYIAGALVFLLAMVAGTLAALLLVLVLVLGVALVGALAGLAGIVVLRSIDHAVRRARRATAVCPRCSWITALPAYRCGECDVPHHDVRPGHLGIWARRCACGARMPTTVLRTVGRLHPACPRCDTPLARHAGVTTGYRIVMAGGPRTGKTRLRRSALQALSAEPPRSTPQAPSAEPPRSTPQAPSAEPPRSTLHAPSAEPPAASDATPGPRLPIRVIRPVTGVLPGALLFVFDPPGEIFLRDEHANHVLSPAGNAMSHVLTLDPLPLPAVRAAASTTTASDSFDDQISIEYAERPYRLLVEQIRDHGLTTRRCSLAVVVTKMDELWSGPGAQRLGLCGHSPPKPRAWLAEVGLRNMILAADRDFGRVQYFFHGTPPDGHFARTPRHFADPSAPFRWLIRHSPRGMAIR